MCAEAYPRLIPARRRQALRLGLFNAALWSAGNSLTTGPLVLYLLQDRDARGLELSMLLAMPNLAGLLRLFAPAVIDRAGNAKRACLALSLASYLLIFGLPLSGLLPESMPNHTALAALLVLLCTHQLLEFLALVALWSWFADLVPLRIRGRYFARRQIWMVAIQIPILLASGYLIDWWRTTHKADPAGLYLGYALPNLLGAVCLMASLVPLARMPATPNAAKPRGASIAWSSIAAPFCDWRFARVLLFRVWLGLSSGITQMVQSTFPKRVLGLGVGDLAFMTTTMRFGQIGASRWIGPFSDRYGNRPLLVLGQVCVAASLLFFVVASPASRASAWLVLGAYVLWSAYAAHNICLPNLVLKLAPYNDKASYVAANDALGSVSHAAATVFGGWWFDHLVRDPSSNSQELPYLLLFWAGIAMRTLAVPLAARLVEPNAWRWTAIWRRTRSH